MLGALTKRIHVIRTKLKIYRNVAYKAYNKKLLAELVTVHCFSIQRYCSMSASSRIHQIKLLADNALVGFRLVAYYKEQSVVRLTLILMSDFSGISILRQDCNRLQDNLHRFSSRLFAAILVLFSVVRVEYTMPAFYSHFEIHN